MSLKKFNDKKINNYVKDKFYLVQTHIKFNYDSFETDCKFDFVINK